MGADSRWTVDPHHTSAQQSLLGGYSGSPTPLLSSKSAVENSVHSSLASVREFLPHRGLLNHAH